MKARPRSRRRWRRAVLVVSLAFAAGAIALGLAATYRPRWYTPPTVDPIQLRDDKASLLALEDQISAALNAGRDVRIRLHADQVNRWLVALDEIYPLPVLPRGGVEQPQVTFDDGVVRLAATVRRGEWGAVLALTGRPELRDDGVLVHYENGSVGALPVPGSWVDGALSHILPPADLQRVRPGAVLVPVEWIWPNGKRRCRVREIHLSPGLAEIVLAPRGVLLR
jgi:hypothetical protein